MTALASALAARSNLNAAIAALEAEAPPPAPSGVIVGVNGGSAKAATVLGLGIKSERITFAPMSLQMENSPLPAQSKANGFSRQAVIIANVDDGTPLSAVNIPALVAKGVEQAKLAAAIDPAVIEAGNEFYLKARAAGGRSDPARAAAIYVPLKKGMLAAGITAPLGFPLYGDYQRADGTWSQVAGGNGWIADAARAQPELVKLCDCLIHHTYGRVGENHENNTGTKALEVTHAQAVALGFKPDVYVTECGRKIGTVVDSETVTSGAMQTEAMKGMLAALKALAFVRGIWPYSVKADPWTFAQTTLEAIALA